MVVASSVETGPSRLGPSTMAGRQPGKAGPSGSVSGALTMKYAAIRVTVTTNSIGLRCRPCSRSPGWRSVPSRHSSSGCRRPRSPVRRYGDTTAGDGGARARHDRRHGAPDPAHRRPARWRGIARTRGWVLLRPLFTPVAAGYALGALFFVSVGTATRPLDVTIGVIVLSMVAIQVVRSVRRTAAAEPTVSATAVYGTRVVSRRSCRTPPVRS